MRSTLLALFLVGCKPEPPAVGTVSPTEGAAGTDLIVKGERFGPGTTATLGGQPLTEAVRVDEQTIQGKVPPGLEPGPATLVVTSREGWTSSLDAAFTVSAPEPAIADACDPELQLITHIPPTADVVKIDRHKKGGEVEHQQIEAREIEAVEYEARIRESALCSSIWIRTRDGRRHLFDSDLKESLRQQAQLIANGLGSRLDIVHEDPAPAAEAKTE